MASTNFYLEKRKDKDIGKIITENVPILLFFSFDGKRLQYFTGFRVDARKWDEESQRVKRNSSEAAEINKELNKLTSKVEDIYAKAKALEVIPTVEYIRDRLKGNKGSKGSFWDVFDEYMEFRTSQAGINTLKKYKSTYNHLQGFSSTRHYRIEFDSINLSFYNKFFSYLAEECEHTNNTISKYIKVLKTFLNYATEQGYNKNLEFRKFAAKEEEGEVIFLTWKELSRLYSMKIKNESLCQVRDVFCFGCFTGLRYSDIYNLKKSNVKGDFLTLNTIKTKEGNKIPLNDYASSILAKYKEMPGEKALPVISNQKMNDHLKELGKLAEFDDDITLVHFRGGKRIETTLPKYEVLTTHIARKTFITTALKLKMQTEVIMSITGHKDHKTFKKYYKVVDEHKLAAMKEIFNKRSLSSKG
jgi:integrase